MTRFPWKSGDAVGVCDRCGKKYYLSELQKEWTGVMVCFRCFEHRHPQDFVRGVPDGKPIMDARPEPEPVYRVEGEDITGDDL